MATRTSLLSLLPLFLLLATLASASVEEVCTRATAGDKNINRDFCVKTLRAAPGGPTADDRRLAVIAGNLASQHARATLAKIRDLLKNATKWEKDALQFCKEEYGDAVEDLKTAAGFAKSGRYDDANVYFSAGITTAAECDEAFSDARVPSPLAAEDSQMFQLSAIGAFITHSGP